MATRHDPQIKAQVLKEYAHSPDSLDVIGARHGIGRSTIVKWADQAGLKRRKPGRKKSPPKTKAPGNSRGGSRGVLRESEGAWVYGTDGIARWITHDGSALR